MGRPIQVSDVSALAKAAQLQALDLRRTKIKRWFDEAGVPALAGLWVDDPEQVPVALRERVQVNPPQDPWKFMRALNRKKREVGR